MWLPFDFIALGEHGPTNNKVLDVKIIIYFLITMA